MKKKIMQNPKAEMRIWKDQMIANVGKILIIENVDIYH